MYGEVTHGIIVQLHAMSFCIYTTLVSLIFDTAIPAFYSCPITNDVVRAQYFGKYNESEFLMLYFRMVLESNKCIPNSDTNQATIITCVTQ